VDLIVFIIFLHNYLNFPNFHRIYYDKIYTVSCKFISGPSLIASNIYILAK